MRIDFYQLGGTPVESALPLIARAVRGEGERLLVVSAEEDGIERIESALWERQPEAFLANGRAGQPHAERQPILLSQSCNAQNGARYLALADGVWRDEGTSFERVFLLFGEAELEGARACWRQMGQMEGVERRFWKQEGGRWREGP